MSTTSTQGGLQSPADKRAVIVLEGGVTVSLRLRSSERYRVSRSITDGTTETGYKLSDGVVNETPEIEIEGIITGSNLITEPNNMARAASEAASLKSAFEREEFASVYLSFIAMPQVVLTELTIEARPKQSYFTVSLTAKRVKTVSFTRATGTAPAAKTKKNAGKSKSTTGKKSATPASEPEKQSALNAIFF